MTGENIICFAKDWDEMPTSNNHVMMELAKNNRVLWLNSIGTRSPRLGSRRDIGKIFGKLWSFARGARRVGKNMWVYTPLVLPWPHSRLASALNRYILRLAIGALRRSLGMETFQLWTFLPNAVDYVGSLGESLAVYYCVDEWSAFSYLDTRKTADAEARLCRRVDVVFASAQSLVTDRLKWNSETYLARHGVDYELFATALDDDTVVPADIAEIRKPIIGFHGTLHDWFDQELIAYLAGRHPEWSIVVIGKVAVDVSKLQGYSNVHLLGRRPHLQLPAYCKAMDVGIIPSVVNRLTRHMNPLKLREYLCAGLPVVSVAIPEVIAYTKYCISAQNYQEFEAGIEISLRQSDRSLWRERSRTMQGEAWERRVADVVQRVVAIKETRCRREISQSR